jgi:hypothetical protein
MEEFEAPRLTVLGQVADAGLPGIGKGSSYSQPVAARRTRAALSVTRW